MQKDAIMTCLYRKKIVRIANGKLSFASTVERDHRCVISVIGIRYTSGRRGNVW